MRGFAGSTHAGPDHPRGSRYILKDYTEGRLLYSHPPPGGWGITQSSLAASSSNKLEFDNVLLPSIQRYHQSAPSLPRIDCDTQATASSTPLNSAASAVSPELLSLFSRSDPMPVADAVRKESESESESDASDNDGTNSLDAELAASFVRKIVLLPDNPTSACTSASGASTSASGAGTSIGISSAKHAASTSTLPDGTNVAQKHRRAPRIAGMGKHGLLKKGRRPIDPYGCEAAADAANRNWHRAEVAAVVEGSSALGVTLLAPAGAPCSTY